MELSVVIPTHDRSAILRKALQALASQSGLSDVSWEIVVVDDGSCDDTAQVLQDAQADGRVMLRHFRQMNRGPAAARNVGIRAAQGTLIILIGDDIIVSDDFVQMHYEFHQQHPEVRMAMLGYTKWSPEIEVTPFMRWLDAGGPQFGYSQIRDRWNVPWGHFYSSNVSLKRAFIESVECFDDDFPYAAFEDTELGYRLHKNGMQLVFNDKACGYHHHAVSVSSYLCRMANVGHSQLFYERKVPEETRRYCLPHEMPQWRRLAAHIKYSCYAGIAILAQNHLVLPRVYRDLMDSARRFGYWKAVRKYPAK